MLYTDVCNSPTAEATKCPSGGTIHTVDDYPVIKRNEVDKQNKDEPGEHYAK